MQKTDQQNLASRRAAMSGREEWQQSTFERVLAHLPPPPARVLEVGCGDGWLVHRLTDLGYESVGIDPDAPEGPHFRKTRLEDLSEDEVYDAVLAVVSLHHIHDLPAGVKRLHALCSDDGQSIIIEFGWDRFQDGTLEWCIPRLPARESDEEMTWLSRLVTSWLEEKRANPDYTAAAHMQAWAEQEGIHSSSQLLNALEAAFETSHFEWIPYLFEDLQPGAESEEADAINDRVIDPVGFLVVGRP
jgi:SAM-dependent methyltransferase